MARLSVAIVGCGIGKNHAKAYAALPELFEIAAICDLDAGKARTMAEEFRVPRVETSYDRLLADNPPAIIDICTPPNLHFAMINQALDAGRHVVAEKPLVASLDHVDRLVERQRTDRARLMPVFQYRFGNGLLQLKHLIARGVAGRAYLATVETAWRRGPDYYAVPWRGKFATELGGCLLTHAIHSHDILTWVLGPIRSVSARTRTLVNPIEVEDCAVAALEMADGSLASLAVTLGSSVETSRLRFCFEHLTADSGLAPYAPGADPWTFTPATDADAAQIQAALADFEPEPELFAGQFRRFHQALTTGGALPVTLDDARRSLELITALYHSAASGAPVMLPIGGDHPRYSGWH